MKMAEEHRTIRAIAVKGERQDLSLVQAHFLLKWVQNSFAHAIKRPIHGESLPHIGHWARVERATPHYDAAISTSLARSNGSIGPWNNTSFLRKPPKLLLQPFGRFPIVYLKSWFLDTPSVNTSVL